MHFAYSICIDEQGTQLCSLHSLIHINADPYPPCSAAIKFHSIHLNSNIPHRPSIAQVCTVSACTQDRPYCHAQYSNYIAATHNITHSPSKRTTHPPIPTPLQKKHKSYLCKRWQNGTRCRDGVKVLWCHSHLVWLVFEASIPTCTCFHLENFL